MGRCDRAACALRGDAHGDGAAAEVPSYFKCPISLCLMLDPVSVCTGITYERSSIQKWLEEGRKTCPVTMQPLVSQELIPNHTLRRIIAAWCTTNKQAAAQSPPPPAPEAQEAEEPRALKARDAASLVRGVKDSSTRLAALRKIVEVAGGDGNREWLAKAGLGMALVGILGGMGAQESIDEGDEEEQAEMIIQLMAKVGLDAEGRAAMLGSSGGAMAALARVLRSGGQAARVAAAAVLEDLAADGGKEAAMALGGAPGVLEGLVRLARDGGSGGSGSRTMRAALRAALAIAGPMKNRVKLVDCGAVAALVEMLPDSERASTEAILAALECLCGCAEGRAAVCEHALAAPAVTKKLFRVSAMATEYAVDILWAVCRYAPDEGVRRRVVEAGLFPKLFFFLQIGCNPRTKQKAGDLLKLLHRAYRECCLEDAAGGNNNTCLLSS